MIVVYNSDERYASAFATSVLSLFENNKDAESICVYLIENGISEESRERIQRIAAQYHREIIIITMPDIEKLAGVDIALPAYNRIATCGRLFIASILPERIEKVIYADCDTMFVDSLSEIWNTDLSGYMVGMVADALCKWDRAILGIQPEGSYYNSGLLLVNVKRWRECHVEKRFMDYLVKQGGYVPFPDQGILNAVFDGEILRMNVACNVHSILYAFSYEELLNIRRPTFFYSKEEITEAVNHPIMVHFTTNFILPLRPWVKGCNHPYVERYLSYRNQTPWKEEPLWEDGRKKRVKYLYSLYAVFWKQAPKALAELVTRTIYTNILPIVHIMKRWRHKNKMITARKRGGENQYNVTFTSPVKDEICMLSPLKGGTYA